MRNFRVTLLVVALLPVMAFSKVDRVQEGASETQIRRINPEFNIRVSPSTSSQSLGRIGEFISSGEFSIDGREMDGEWLRVRTSKGDGWVHRGSLQEVNVKSNFTIRAEPRIMSENRGTIGDGNFSKDEDAIFTGRSEIETRNGDTHKWNEVFIRGERAWIHENAVIAKEEKKNPSETIVPAEDKSDGKTEPMCVGSLAEAKRSERFQKLLAKGNPFTTWNGPWGATIVVQANGQAILNHPLKGRIPLTVTLCMDRREVPYIVVNGTKVYFDDAAMSSIQVKDPTSGETYEFRRGVQ